MSLPRRSFLRGLAASAAAVPAYRFLGPSARAGAMPAGGTARRVIFFYFPDGVPAASQDGDPSLWHARGSGSSFSLPPTLRALEPYRDQSVFFRGLSMGPFDMGNHPGGVKKLLTAVDGGNGTSIDTHLANTVGAGHPFRHVYLGAQANINGGSSDRYLTYVSPGQSVAPEDDPLAAFERLFGVPNPGGDPPAPGDDSPGPAPDDPRRQQTLSVLDANRADLEALQSRLGGVDRVKLDLHLEALREVEGRVRGMGGGGSGGGGGGGGTPAPPSCDDPFVEAPGVNDGTLYAPELFPTIFRAQIDVMVQAMACGLTRVGTLQASHHTSDLAMSRFEGTPMHDPGSDMRSHQASHYGPRHDFGKREFADFVEQRAWFVDQLAYLLDSLRQRPEGDGTMLDYSLVLVCSEVSDGNTHSHDNMPFILCGGGGGAVRTGQVLDVGYHRHADLLVAIARALGSDVQTWGQESRGPLPGLLA